MSVGHNKSSTKKGKKRPKSEMSDDEDFKPNEDVVGKVLAARAAREAKKVKK